jgi:hypothetical protein
MAYILIKKSLVTPWNMGLFCTSEIMELIARKSNRYAQKFLENTPNLKSRSSTHHWKEMNRNEVIQLPAFFLLQGLHQKLGNELFFLEENSGNTHIFGPVQ